MKHNMIREIFTVPFAVLTLLIVMLSCTRDFELPLEPAPDPDQFGKQVTISLTLTVPSSAEPTKGLNTAEESGVKTADILLFDKDSVFVGYYHGESVSALGSMVYFEAEVTGSQNSTDKFLIMVLTNSRDLTSTLFPGNTYGGHKGISYYRDICSLLKSSRPTISDLISKGIPMWGELQNMELITENISNYYSLTLIRSLARVDIGTNASPTYGANNMANYAELSNFSMEEVYIYQGGKTYRVGPDRGKYDFNIKNVGGVTLPIPNPEDTVKYDGAAITRSGGKGISVTSEIYTGESDIIQGGTYGDGKHLDRMAVVVGGNYTYPDGVAKPTMSYYRIDFYETDDKTAILTDVKRNNLYQIVITSVNGPGSDTPDEAFKKFNVDITSEIKSWNLVDLGNTVSIGQWFMRLSSVRVNYDKWASTDTLIQVTTNVASGWKAEVTSSTPWLRLVDNSLVTQPSISGVSGESFRLAVDALPSTTERSGKITVTVKTPDTDKVLTNDVIVTQRYLNGKFFLTLSETEIIIPGNTLTKVGTNYVRGLPLPDTLDVKYGPPNNPYRISMVTNLGSGIQLKTALPDTTRASNIIFALDSIPHNDSHITESNPFYERSSWVKITSYDETKADSITKVVNVRQIHYALLLTRTLDYYFQGREYTFRVRSNTPWKATFSTEAHFVAGSVVKTGVGVTSSDGEFIKFRISPTAPVDAVVTLTVENDSPDLRIEPQVYTINIQDEYPNCYIVGTNQTLYIPVAKANRVWRLDRDLKGETAPSGAASVSILWREHITSTDLMVDANVSLVNGGTEIRVNTQSLEGNALVRYMRGTEVIWSWHIWITNYNPNTTNVTVPSTGVVFMDRDLGAFANAPGSDVTRSYGLFYQVGRKDPFLAQSVVQNGAYDILPNMRSYRGYIAIDRVPPTVNLAASIKNPSTFYLSNYGTTSWYGGLIEPRADLWTSMHKTDYDPCPEGWKIGALNDFRNLDGSNFTPPTALVSGGYNVSPLGFLPMQGNIYVNGAYQTASGSWSATFHHTNDEHRPGTWGATAGNVGYGIVSTFGNGHNVRCVRDIK